MDTRAVKMRADRGGFVFEPTAAVAVSRTRSRYIDCPVCQADHSEYLFHRTGIRFVRCSNCAMVYVTPASERGSNWLDIEAIGQYVHAADRALAVADFDALVARFAAEYERVEGRPLRRAVLLGASSRVRDQRGGAARRARRHRHRRRELPALTVRVSRRLGGSPARPRGRARHPPRDAGGVQRRRGRPPGPPQDARPDGVAGRDLFERPVVPGDAPPPILAQLLRLQDGVLQYLEPRRADGSLRLRAHVTGPGRRAPHG